jgi:NAD-dependent deacetylase
LWEGHRIEDVCTPEAWQSESGAGVGVLFARSAADGAKAEPNPAHVALAELEARLGARFFLCTQNVDDLHERAGSKRLVHMHGELAKSRCEWTSAASRRLRITCSLSQDLSEVGRCACAVGGLRPHIVFFGEIPLEMDRIQRGDSKAYADGGRGNFRLGLSGGQLCALGAAGRRAHGLHRTGGAAGRMPMRLRMWWTGGKAGLEVLPGLFILIVSTSFATATTSAVSSWPRTNGRSGTNAAQ